MTTLWRQESPHLINQLSQRENLPVLNTLKTGECQMQDVMTLKWFIAELNLTRPWWMMCQSIATGASKTNEG